MRLSPRPLGRTGLSVTPLALAHGAIRGHGPRGLSLSPDDVEAAYHEHGVTTFLAYPGFAPVVEGVRRLVRQGLRDRLVLGEGRPGILAYTATRWGFLLKPLPERGFPQAMSGGECYRFALSHPRVDAVFCAARTRGELREDVEAVLAGPLPPERLAECRRFGDAVHAAARGGSRFMFREARPVP